MSGIFEKTRDCSTVRQLAGEVVNRPHSAVNIADCWSPISSKLGKYRLWLLVLFLPLILWSQNSSAFQAPDLKIILVVEAGVGTSSSQDKALTKDWKKSCKVLGNRLKTGQGPFGFGMFGNYSCFVGEEKISGASGEFDWILEVKVTSNSVLLTIKNKGRVEAKQTVIGGANTIRYLIDPGFCDDLAFALTRSLPVLMSVSRGTQSKGIFGRGLAISDATNLSNGRFDPPGELVLFHLSYNSDLKVWIPERLGKASLRYYDKAKFSSTEQRKSRGRVFWDATFSAHPRKDEIIWAQAAEGRGQLITDEQVAVKIQNAYDALEIKFGRKKGSLFGFAGSYLLDTAAAGYVGARYGRQFIAKDDLLGNSSFWGLLVEIRSGPLDGLRFYYDQVPEVRSRVASGDTYLKWSRFTGGMSFGFHPGMLVDKIDIVPKIGRWNFSALLPIQTPTQTFRQEFRVDNRLSLALEVGLEWIGNWYTVRSWASQDQSLVFGSIDTSGIITSRIGLDTFIGAGPAIKISSSKLKTTFLVFVVMESIKLRAANGSVEETDRFRVDEIDFDSAYAGGGLVFSW